MKLIGENIHILSKVVSQAIAERQKEPLQDLAIRQEKAGVDYIDINVGPLKKDPETLRWLTEIIQEVVDVPLSLDTMNAEAMDMALGVINKKRPLINSASGKQESKERMMPLVKKYNCDVIISVITDSGIPPDAASRAEAIMETVAYANELGIPNEDIWVDPVMMPIAADQNAVVECLEFMKILPDICPETKSSIGLSNLCGGAPAKFKGILTRTFLVMLERYNLYSAIVDSFDEELIKLMRGELPELKSLIYKAMDEEIPISSLSSQNEIDYVKTVNVLLGKTLYSHAWLEV